MSSAPSSSYVVRANFLRKTILVTVVLAVITAILVPISLTTMPRSSSDNSSSTNSANSALDTAILPVGPARALYPDIPSSSSTTSNSSSSSSSSSLPATNLYAIPVTDSNLYFTPHNWRLDMSTAVPFQQTSCVGAYFKFKVSGTRQVWIAFDQTNAPTSAYMSLRWYIDTDPTNYTQYNAVVAQKATTDASSSALRAGTWYLPTSLVPVTVGATTYQAAALPLIDQTTSHTIFVVVRAADSSVDRWVTPASRARIVSILVNATSSATALSPAAVAPYTTIVYSDSIGEGYNALSTSVTRSLDNSDASRAFWVEMARRLRTEVSVVAYTRQGYTIGGQTNVPMLVQTLLVDPLRDGVALMPSWSYHDQTYSRLTVSSMFATGARITPNCIMVTHGMWDALNPLANPSVLVTNVYNTLVALRGAAPSSALVVVTPFGGFSSGYVLQGYKTYLNATNDANTYIVDLSARTSVGLNQYGTPMPGVSYDGIHPTAERSTTIGQLIATQLASLYP